MGCVPTNKYAEGYPGRRYYGGCEVVDEIEQLAIDRAKELFGAEHANVQPHAGAQTNMAVYFSCLEPGDTMLAMRLDHGGHLTHGLKVNFSGHLYIVVGYGVDRETGLVDFDEVRTAREGAPAEADRLRRLRVSADDRGRPLPRDRRRGRRASPLRHGPLRRARRGRPPPEPDAALRLRHLDDAQDARGTARRLRALQGGAREGPRPGGVPGDAGWPAPARDRGQGDVLSRSPPPSPSAPTRRRSARTRTRSLRPWQRAASTCSRAEPTRISCSSTSAAATGRARTAEERLHEVRITANRNTVPFDERPPTVASGVRLGTPAVTMRGFDEDDLREVGEHHRRRARPGRRTSTRSGRAAKRSARSGRSTRGSAGSRRYQA